MARKHVVITGATCSGIKVGRSSKDSSEELVKKASKQMENKTGKKAKKGKAWKRQPAEEIIEGGVS